MNKNTENVKNAANVFFQIYINNNNNYYQVDMKNKNTYEGVYTNWN